MEHLRHAAYPEETCMKENYSATNDTVNDTSDMYRPTYSPATHAVVPAPSGTSAQVENARVIAMAGLSAGALAGLGALLGDRRNKPKTKSEIARMILEEAANAARKEARKVDLESKKAKTKIRKGAETSLDDAATLLTAARHEADSAGKKAASSVEETVGKIVELVNSARDDAAKKVTAGRTAADEEVSRVKEAAPSVDEAKDELTAAAEAVREQVAHSAEAVRENAEASADRLKENAVHTADVVREKAEVLSGKAKDDASRARGDVGKFLASLKDRLLEVERVNINDRVKPTLADVSSQAAHLIEQGKGLTDDLKTRTEEKLIPQMREQAAHLVEQGKGLTEELKARTEDEIIPQMKEQAQATREKVAETVHHVAEGAQPFAATVSHKMTEGANAAQDMASGASSAVKQGTKDTRSLLMWLAIAAALIFTVFLDKDQQERVKRAGGTMISEVSSMYSDMRHEDKSLEGGTSTTTTTK